VLADGLDDDSLRRSTMTPRYLPASKEVAQCRTGSPPGMVSAPADPKLQLCSCKGKMGLLEAYGLFSMHRRPNVNKAVTPRRRVPPN
jgi:hypothetical protein